MLLCPFRSLTPQSVSLEDHQCKSKSLQLVLGSSISADLGVEELGETSLRPLAIKVNNGVVAGLDQLDGGEALHLDLFQFVGSAEKKTCKKVAKSMEQDMKEICCAH